jgi:hypothetical protein
MSAIFFSNATESVEILNKVASSFSSRAISKSSCESFNPASKLVSASTIWLSSRFSLPKVWLLALSSQTLGSSNKPLTSSNL